MGLATSDARAIVLYYTDDMNCGPSDEEVELQITLDPEIKYEGHEKFKARTAKNNTLILENYSGILQLPKYTGIEIDNCYLPLKGIIHSPALILNSTKSINLVIYNSGLELILFTEGEYIHNGEIIYYGRSEKKVEGYTTKAQFRDYVRKYQQHLNKTISTATIQTNKNTISANFNNAEFKYEDLDVCTFNGLVVIQKEVGSTNLKYDIPTIQEINLRKLDQKRTSLLRIQETYLNSENFEFARKITNQILEIDAEEEKVLNDATKKSSYKI